jgi:hypothetical protein
MYWSAAHLQAEASVDSAEDVAPVGHDLQELPSL